jgi:tetratricopeptide (TPR) repeat protein
MIGRIANARQDHATAAERYFSALARSPRDQTLLNGALVASLAAGDEALARRAARMAPLEGAPAYAHLVRASDALVVRRWGAAASELEDIEGAAAEELLARMELLWARAGQSRVDDVLMELAPMAQIRPYGALFAYQQAMALDYAGRGDEALVSYRIAASGGFWLPAGIERHADLLVRRGARDEAIALLSTEANRANPALSAALVRVQSGSNAAAEPLTPAFGAAVGLYGMSAIYFQEGDATDGFAALTLALMLNPRFDDAHLAFAQQQSRLGHADLAIAALARVDAASPHWGSARIMESWVRFDAGDRDGAVALAQANAAGGEVAAQRALADIYRTLDRYAESEAAYSVLIEREPGNWRNYFARGAARERLGRWQDAEADLQHALALSPGQPDVMNYLGYSWVDRGDRLQEGLDMIQRALELRPSSGAIMDSLGWAYYRMADYQRALTYIERAVELEPSDATLNDHLGDVYWRLGRRIEARFQWQRALTLEPDNPSAIQTKLDSGLPAELALRAANR